MVCNVTSFLQKKKNRKVVQPTLDNSIYPLPFLHWSMVTTIYRKEMCKEEWPQRKREANCRFSTFFSFSFDFLRCRNTFSGEHFLIKMAHGEKRKNIREGYFIFSIWNMLLLFFPCILCAGEINRSNHERKHSIPEEIGGFRFLGASHLVEIEISKNNKIFHLTLFSFHSRVISPACAFFFPFAGGKS